MAIFLQLPLFKISLGRKGAKSKVYGWPIAKVGLVYGVLQLIISLLAMIFSPKLPITVIVAASIVLLAGAGIGVIATDAAREAVEIQGAKVVADTKTMMELKCQVKALAAKYPNKELQELAELFTYSDPVSSETTRELEQRLIESVNELSSKGYESTGDDKDLVQNIRCVLEERNEACVRGKA